MRKKERWVKKASYILATSEAVGVSFCQNRKRMKTKLISVGWIFFKAEGGILINKEGYLKMSLNGVGVFYFHFASQIFTKFPDCPNTQIPYFDLVAVLLKSSSHFDFVLFFLANESQSECMESPILLLQDSHLTLFWFDMLVNKCKSLKPGF